MEPAYLTDDFCCRLLAWLGVTNGTASSEAFVTVSPLKEDVQAAIKRVSRNAALLIKTNEYKKELETSVVPLWLRDFIRQYNVSPDILYELENRAFMRALYDLDQNADKYRQPKAPPE